MTWRSAALVGLLVVVGAVSPGCVRVRGSAVTHAGQEGHAVTEEEIARVRILALSVPSGAVELGLIEASGFPDIRLLVREFARQAASVGGNLAKLDKVETGFETVRQSSQESYSCGTSTAPRTCQRTVYKDVEVATTKLVGRAFKEGK